MTQPFDTTWRSADGLTLSARIYPGDPTSLPVLCLPGLTRNGRDFAALAQAIAPRHPVICPDLRGRGNSQWASDPATYTPAHYVGDVIGLLAARGIDRFVAVGTSLGGLMTMMLAAALPGRIAGAVLNDIGPEIDPAGLARIRGYVGQPVRFADWDAAAQALATAQGAAFPRFGADDWMTFAQRSMRVADDGAIVFDYDMAIAQPFAQDDGASPAPDLWPLFAALGQSPLLVVRGALSDILSADTAALMVAQHPEAELVTVADVGHAPTLDEPEAQAAILALLDQAA
jgi:pimeloyl-ACP methyl ester carboxylesterase